MSKSTRVLVSIITVNYHSLDKVMLLAASLRPQMKGDIEWFIVDNSDDTKELNGLHKISFAKIIDARTNLGFGTANNLAVKESRGEYLFFLNPDTVIDSKFLERLKRQLAKYGSGMIASMILNEDGSIQRSTHRSFPGLTYHAWEYSPFIAIALEKIVPSYHPSLFPVEAYKSVHHPKHVLGAALIMSRHSFDQLDGFDEDFFLYREETDLLKRANDAGIDLVYLPDLKITHFSGGASGNSVLAQLDTRYTKSVYIYQKKHSPYLVWIAWLIAFLGLTISVLGFSLLTGMTLYQKSSYRVALQKTFNCLIDHLLHPLAFGW